MANITRVYNVPLRKEFLKVPLYKRTPKAMKALKQFLTRHMKSEDIRLSEDINNKMWERGIKSPPHHIKVEVTKDDKGVVKVELFGVKKKVDKKAAKKATKAPAKKETKKAEAAGTVGDKSPKSVSKKDNETEPEQPMSL